MINTSNEYNLAIRGERELYSRDRIVFSNGEEVQLTNRDLMNYSISGATSDDSSFQVGAAIAKKHTLTLNNHDGKFDAYDFEDANIIAAVGLQLSNSVEVVKKGTYRINSAVAGELTIEVESYDSMIYFDRPYSESTLTYPATVRQIIADACICCQMTFDASSLRNGDYIVSEKPEGEALTFRDMISYCAQLMCCYARININDILEFGWYDVSVFERNESLDGGTFDTSTPYASGDTADGGNFTDYSSGNSYDGGTFAEMKDYHHFYNLKTKEIHTDDIVVTGIQVAVGSGSDKETYLYGEEGYVIEIVDNPLIQSGDAESVASYIGSCVIGYRFRPLRITIQSNPAIEEGDVAYATDRKQRTYQTLITYTEFVLYGTQAVDCSAETKVEKNYQRFSASTKAIIAARNETKVQLTEYDLAVQQLTSLITQSFGVHKSKERLEDGSYIYYMHDKSTLAESKTIWKMTADAFAVSTDGGKTWNAGMDSAGNAVVNVLNAIGINADWIRAGRIESRDGSSFWDLASGLLSIRGEFYTSDYNHWGEEWISIIDSMIKGGIDSNYDSLIDMCAQYGGGERWMVIENKQSGIRLIGDKVVIGQGGDPVLSGRNLGYGMLGSMGKNYVSNGYWMQLWDTSGAAFGLISITQSDERLKENINDTETDGLGIINQIRHVDYDWIETGDHVENGYLAQQLKSVNEQLAVHEEESDTWYFDSNAILRHATKAIQELSAKVDRLERALGRAGIEIEEVD